MSRTALGSLLGVTILAGCGGSGKTIVTQTHTVTVSSASSGSTTATATTRSTTSPRIALGRFTFPPSATGTQCSVDYYRHAAELTFSSNNFNVTPACQRWVHASATAGQYWVLVQFPRGQATTTVCTVLTQHGKVAAVVDDSGKNVIGTQACSELIAAGWVEAQNGGGGTATGYTAPPPYTDPSGVECNRSLVGPQRLLPEAVRLLTRVARRTGRDPSASSFMFVSGGTSRLTVASG